MPRLLIALKFLSPTPRSGLGIAGSGEAKESSRSARARQRLGVRAASLGATPLLQAGRQGEAGGHSTPRESGVADAGLRRASLPPQSKTLSR